MASPGASCSGLGPEGPVQSIIFLKIPSISSRLDKERVEIPPSCSYSQNHSSSQRVSHYPSSGIFGGRNLGADAAATPDLCLLRRRTPGSVKPGPQSWHGPWKRDKLWNFTWFRPRPLLHSHPQLEFTELPALGSSLPREGATLPKAFLGGRREKQPKDVKDWDFCPKRGKA